jgi:hypothetical protein
MSRIAGIATLLSLVAVCSVSLADELSPGVRGVATRAPEGIQIDGNLQEFAEAFCTPVSYFEPDVANRAAQFLYMWDDEAFYAGLRTLDQKQANPAPDDRLWEGDGVEWYFDTRRGPDFRGHDWGPGAVHMYWTAYKNDQVQPRWCLRPDMLRAIPGTGVEVAGRQTAYGAETEFKLPWANFPDFRVKQDEVIGLDAELCYSDGAARVYRSFAYGSPLSVQQPASQARVQLVEKLEPAHWRQCGPVLCPVRCDTAWTQETNAFVTGYAALPPNHERWIGRVAFRVLDLEGATLGEYDGQVETLNAEGGFYRATATWPTEVAVPGGHHLLAVLYDREGNELARVAPRLVSVNNAQGY